MDRAMLNYFVDVIMAISFVISLATGIFKWPGLLQFFGISPFKVPLLLISTMHDWSGLVMGMSVLIHLMLHWPWIVLMTKKLGKKGNLIPLFLTLCMIPLIVTGCSSKTTVVENSDTTGDFTFQQPSCPKGITNDPYPGLCGSYTDSDKNGICDFGQIN